MASIDTPKVSTSSTTPKKPARNTSASLKEKKRSPLKSPKAGGGVSAVGGSAAMEVSATEAGMATPTRASVIPTLEDKDGENNRASKEEEKEQEQEEEKEKEGGEEANENEEQDRPAPPTPEDAIAARKRIEQAEEEAKERERKEADKRVREAEELERRAQRIR